MQDQMDSNDDYETVTCRWLRANEDLWMEWLPDATNCFPGFGLFHSLSGTYVQDRDDRTGKTCSLSTFLCLDFCSLEVNHVLRGPSLRNLWTVLG